MTPTKQRHNEKVHAFAYAIDRLGWNQVCMAVGDAAVSKLDLARDALNRGQHDSIVANFLADAQILGEKHCNIENDDVDIYDVLKSLK